MYGYWSFEKVVDQASLWNEMPSSKAIYYGGATPVREAEDGRQLILNPVSTALIYLLPIIGITEITTANIDDVYTRIHMYETAAGPVGYDAQKTPVRLTLANIRRHVGLEANAGVAVKFEEVLIDGLRKQAREALQNEKPIGENRNLAS